MPSLPSLLVALLLCPVLAAQQPSLGPASAAPGDLAPGPAGGEQLSPQVAGGDDGVSLAVWIDHRAEFNSPLANQGGPDVFAMRLGPDGQALDPVALRLPGKIGDKQHAKAAWNGNTWLVTWENQDPDAFSSFNRLLLGARVAGDGTLLDSDPIVIKDDDKTVGGTTALASDGVDWVLTVQGTPSSNGAVVALRIAPDGSVVNPTGTLVANLSVAFGNGDLAYADGVFLLVYSPGSSMRGVRFDDSLTPLGSSLSIGTGSSVRPRVATDGDDFLVVWENTDLGASIRARQVSAASGALSAQLQLTQPSNGLFNRRPDVAWSGHLWHVVFTDQDASRYRMTRVRPNLLVLDFGGVELPVGAAISESTAVLAGAPDAVTMVFESVDLTQNWGREIEAARVDDVLVASAPETLSLSATRQGFPSLVAGDGQFLAVFTAEQDATTVIKAQRFGAFGAPLDAEPLVLAAGNRYGEPRAAWNGEHYLVVWEDRVVVSFQTDDLVLGARVTPDGSLLDATPLLLMEGSKPDVAAQGSEFLVVSTESASGDPDLSVPWARRFAGDGTPFGPRVQLGSLFARYARVAPLGDGWIAVWQRQFSHDNPNSVVRAALIGADGTPTASVLVDGDAGFGGASRPNVASAGDSALLVWQANGVGLASSRVLSDGSVQAATPLTPLPAEPSLPEVSWNGEDYLVTWQDFRAQVGLWDQRLDIYAARVSEDGTLIDGGGGFAVAAGDETELLSTGAGAFGTHLLGWIELLPEAPHATLRLVLRRDSPWATEGGGVGGSNAQPLLLARGDLLPGGALGFRLQAAPALAAGALIVGSSALGLPFKGGTLVPAIDVLLPINTDTEGVFALEPSLPAGVPSGLPVFVQCWVQDPGAPAGFAGSNAVSSVTR